MYDTLTNEQAQELVRYIEARAVLRLAQLAHRMLRTGGPLGEMDASLESLVPMWDWFCGIEASGYLDTPTAVPPLHEPLIVAHAAPGTADLQRRRMVMLEGLEHYIELVLRRIDPGARWDLWLQTGRIRMARHQEPVIRMSDGTAVHVLSLVAGLQKRGQDPDPSRLRTRVSDEIPRARRPRSQQREASVLEPYLAHLGAPVPDALAISPLTVLYPASSTTAGSDGSSGDDFGVDLLLAVGPAAGLDDPGQFAALPVDTVAAVLAELGLALDDGRPVGPRQLLQDGTQLVDPEGTVVVETVVARGALRALSVEPAGGGTAETWMRIEDRLRGCAESLGGHLVAADSEGWPEP
ncbi:hypothetical protein [Cellulomonas phragmiteti]|uniref:Uncharacterized protein n=1 Tax=Cellulomonas phragmiteti TaxID=478780 RepID=A0ABQ4DQT8_9CELL|nr:hypothetical protein [Cellulomonas phragmiteti]GIG41703.1 hypothetical protein Cph01nite_34650 [Cellulomonas phragmiteti]